jgi:tetratricopeptide (TPR) repeat protein
MRTFLLVLSFFIITGCTSAKVNSTLKDVESYISERPDSALSVLESIDRADLKGRRSEAHHALLHAMALDKNYIDVTDDSLASIAVRYYQKHGPKKYLARSLYYKGLSYYYNKEYDKSIIELSKAEPIASTSDSLYLGFVKMLQASIHDINYNDIEELRCLEDALDIYKAIGAEYYIIVAKLGLANSYISNGKYEDAEILLEEILYTKELNKKFTAKANGDYAFLMGTRPDPDYKTSVTYFEKSAEVENSRYISRKDYWVWAHALAKTGDFERSQQIIDILSPIDTSGTAYYWQYAIAKTQDNTSEALELFEKFSDRNNEEVEQILKQSISSVQKDYYQSQYQIADYKAKNRSLILIILVISSLFFITLVLFSTVRYRRIKEEEKEQYIRYAEEVSRQLDELKNDTYPTLQKKYITMYKTRYETLRTLFDKYLHSEDRIDAESIVYRQVVSLIKELRKDIENDRKLERTLDADLGGIMTCLKTEFPNLKQKDYTLFGYLALGFDALIISRLMGTNQNTIYVSKYRLKKLIEASNTSRKSEFLTILS